MVKKLTLVEGHPPQLEGQWTIGEVLAAAEFLRSWIEQQQIAVQQPPPPDGK